MSKRTIVTDIFGLKVSTINQKQKGNKNESVLAKYLCQLTGREFTRTPSSGGRRFKNAKNFCGDVVCCDDDYNFAFCVETKHWKEIFMEWKLRQSSVVYTIWKQAEKDAKRANRIPILFLRFDGMPAKKYWVFLERKVALHLGLKEEITGETIVGVSSDNLLKINYTKHLNDGILSLYLQG
jgi:hypothetical protein